MIYLGVYAALLIANALSWGLPGPRRVLYRFALFALFVFVGFRFKVGCDWPVYNYLFEAERFTSLEDALTRSESGFWMLIRAVHFFDLEFPAVNVAAAAIFFLGLHMFARRQADPLAILTLAFPILIINLPMSAIRQAMALGVLAVAFNAFVDRHLLRYVGLVVAASLFHTSSVVFLLMSPLATGAFTIRRIAAAVVLAAPGIYFLSSGDYFTAYSDRYGSAVIDAAGAIYRTGLLAVTGAVFAIVFGKRWFATYPRDYSFVFVSAILMLGTFAISFFSPVVGDRFGYYLSIAQLAILARLPSLAQGRNERQLTATLPYAVLGLVLLIWTQSSTLFSLCFQTYQLWW